MMYFYGISRRNLNLNLNLNLYLFFNSLHSPQTLNPESPTPLTLIFPPSPSLSPPPPFLPFFPFSLNPFSQISNTFYFRRRRCSRSFSASPSALHASGKQVSEIVNLIRSGESDLESKLDDLNVSLSEASLRNIFGILNSNKVSALRFFCWIRQSHPHFYHKSDICSLVIDNCGRLDDFDSISDLFIDFGVHGINLNQKAFRFLPVKISSKAATEKQKYICKVVDMLNQIGGLCGVSGIHALLKILCDLRSFKMAEYVIANTEKRLSYYNILIRGRCSRGHFEEARKILDGMIEVGCNPNSQIYNYVLSCLCKDDKTAEAFQLLEQMLQSGSPPDALTFEILICYFCRHGKLDMALEGMDTMESNGIEPRATTHAALIKGYFRLRQYQEAHSYVVVCSDRYKNVGNMIYSLLASLHRKRGKPSLAQRILSEMIEKGLKPNFTVYKAVKKHLQNSGREDLARNLESRFSKLISQPSADNG